MNLFETPLNRRLSAPRSRRGAVPATVSNYTRIYAELAKCCFIFGPRLFTLITRNEMCSLRFGRGRQCGNAGRHDDDTHVFVGKRAVPVFPFRRNYRFNRSDRSRRRVKVRPHYTPIGNAE